MKEIIKNMLILFAITLVVGVLLGLVYEITEEPIAVQEEKAKQEAYAEVFSDASSFEELEFDADALAEYIASHEEGVDASVAGIVEIVEALDSSGELLGYVFTVDSYKGYGGTIEFTVGVTIDGTCNGYSILSIDETAGLGAKAQTDTEWAAQFAGVNVSYFTYTKSGSTSESEVDAISGATYTTKAMVYGINCAIFAAEYLNGEVSK